MNAAGQAARRVIEFTVLVVALLLARVYIERQGGHTISFLVDAWEFLAR